MKTVWVFNHYAQGPDDPGGARHHALATHLREFGWRAEIIAASVQYLSLTQRLGDGETRRLEHLGGVPFLWLRTPAWRGDGLARIATMLIYAARALRRRNLRGLSPPDAIVGSSVHPFAAWVGAVWARRLGVPFVYEVRDLWPLTLIEMGRLRAGGPVARFFTELERRCARRAALLVSVLPGAGTYFARYGVPASRFLYLPNGIDAARSPEPAPREDTGSFTVMYVGAHGQANGLDVLLDAMARLRDRPIRARLVGEGALKPALRASADALGLDHVRFEAPVAKHRVADVLGEADAFVLLIRDLPGLYRFGYSMNKMFDYLAAGRPVVIAAPEGENPVTRAGAGIRVPPDDPAALADAIAELAQRPAAERAAMGRAGRDWVLREHDYRVLAGRFAVRLDALSAPGSATEGGA